jgi:hypothetical protein
MKKLGILLSAALPPEPLCSSASPGIRQSRRAPKKPQKRATLGKVRFEVHVTVKNPSAKARF